MSCIAIITARGGSKRIPQKNIKKFCGKPIIAYSIETAIKSNLFDEVMVSTDDENIAAIAKKYGAQVPFMRSEKTSGDYATTREVILEVLNEYRNRGRVFEQIFCLYPTAPFITENKLKEAQDLMKKNAARMVLPVVKFSYPPQRAYVISEGRAKFKWEEFRNVRTQDLEEFYHDAGQFYCYDAMYYMKCKGYIRDGIIPYILPESETQDIDNWEDWKMAEIKYQIMKGMI